jgi:hypothetical protein
MAAEFSVSETVAIVVGTGVAVSIAVVSWLLGWRSARAQYQELKYELTLLTWRVRALDLGIEEDRDVAGKLMSVQFVGLAGNQPVLTGEL